jgi:hypothetical protein
MIRRSQTIYVALDPFLDKKRGRLEESGIPFASRTEFDGTSDSFFLDLRGCGVATTGMFLLHACFDRRSTDRMLPVVLPKLRALAARCSRQR